MDNLPGDRVQPARPFSIIGVDLADPFIYKCIGHRLLTHSITFVCFTARALHPELVANLSTDDFICFLKLFIAFRGIMSKVYSDNGANSVGARNQLALNYAAGQGLEWAFIPPHAPSFGDSGRPRSNPRNLI